MGKAIYMGSCAELNEEWNVHSDNQNQTYAKDTRSIKTGRNIFEAKKPAQVQKAITNPREFEASLNSVAFKHGVVLSNQDIKGMMTLDFERACFLIKRKKKTIISPDAYKSPIDKGFFGKEMPGEQATATLANILLKGKCLEEFSNGWKLHMVGMEGRFFVSPEYKVYWYSLADYKVLSRKYKMK